MPIFSETVCFELDIARDGAMNMAMDELLLAESDGVVYRFYEWAQPTTSIGYFGDSSDILTKHRAVRRPTGGGMVEHGVGSDFTYSVIVSSTIARDLELKPRASYRLIHGALVAALRQFGIDAVLAGVNEPTSGGAACFVNPVGDDVMLGGNKIAGAGQKRSRGAFLHQGSVQMEGLPPIEDLGLALANQLATNVTQGKFSAEFLSRAERLAKEKYRSDVWNFRR